MLVVYDALQLRPLVALAALPAPLVTRRTKLMIAAIGGFGLLALAPARWWRRSGQVPPRTRMDDALHIAKEDASDLARMGSDAG